MAEDIEVEVVRYGLGESLCRVKDCSERRSHLHDDENPKIYRLVSEKDLDHG